jgi:SAM-dependent methyltransferase
MSVGSAEMHAYYAARAPYYDAVYAKPERANDTAFLQGHLPERLAGRSVLEIACGTGYWTQHIAPHTSRMLASDGTPEPLAFARLRPGCAAVDFRLLDAYELPDELGQFNAAFAGLWFSHVPKGLREAFLKGLHARLQPGARVILIDNNEVQCRELPIAETDGDGNTWQHRTLRDGATHRVLKNFPSEAELRALLTGQVARCEYRMLDNFWLLEYELNAR